MIAALAMAADLFLVGAIGGLVFPFSGKRAPRFLENIAGKLDRPGRAGTTLRVRALVMVIALPAIGVLAGMLIEQVARATQYGWGIEIVVLSILLGQHNIWTVLKVGLHAGGDDPHSTRRRAIGKLADLVGQRLIGVLVWYGVFGLTGALAYQVVLCLPSEGRSKPFRGPLIALKRIVLLPPTAVAGLIISIACLVVPRGAPIAAFKALMALMALAPETAARGLVAAGLALSLDGPGGWLGSKSGRARLEPADVYAAAILYGAVWITMLGISLLAEGELILF